MAKEPELAICAKRLEEIADIHGPIGNDAKLDLRETAEYLAVVEKRIEELERKLEIAAVIFDEYGRLHRKKGTPEGDLKAERNEQYAAEMRAVLPSVVLMGEEIPRGTFCYVRLRGLAEYRRIRRFRAWQAQSSTSTKGEDSRG